jgi:hypothetical protein
MRRTEMVKCARETCQNAVDNAGDYCEKCLTVAVRGWFTPGGETQSGNKCVVGGCNRDAAFHLCEQHAIPGIITEYDGVSRVISFWLVERGGKMQLIDLSDYVLGRLFDGQQGFEDCLGVRGFKVHRLISSEVEMEATKQRYPALSITSGSLLLSEGQGS